MNYSTIKSLDIANGLGVRISLFVSGCRNRCKGCFNACTWDFHYGNVFTKDTEDEILELLKPSHISGLSILGGDPFEEENQQGLFEFVQKVKKSYPDKDIWCWSGYTLEEILSKKKTEYTKIILDCLDFLIDGRFIESKKNIMLKYRGSENQRIWKKINGNWGLDEDLMGL